MNTALRLAFVAGSLLAGSAVVAQDQPTPAERAHQVRQAHMMLFAYNLGPLGAMAKGEMEWNGDLAATHAQNIASLASVDMSSYWVEGSDSELLEDSRALPAIWDNLDDVASKEEAVAKAATAAAQAAGEGQEAFAAAFADLGKSCGGCHEDYRLRED